MAGSGFRNLKAWHCAGEETNEISINQFAVWEIDV